MAQSGPVRKGLKLSYLRGGTHASQDGRSRPPLKPPIAAPPLRGAALLVGLPERRLGRVTVREHPP
jgi:hypothetical protein